ncbi:MAG: inositol monophosphatase family protein, partial [Candidatus Hermodarchaeota archaeon]
MEITIDFLKTLAIEVYEKINPLLGTAKAGELTKKGAGGDISMYIDLLSEKTIMEILEKNNINVLLISEEVGEKYIGDKSVVIKEKSKLIVDPIDGSNNAARGIPYTSVSIAYAIGEKIKNIEMAVIIDLNTKDLYYAEKGKGAFKNGHPINVSEMDISQKCVFELDVPVSEFFKRIDQLMKILKRTYRIRIMGSTALTLCQVASGAVDAFLDLSITNRLVDVAAGFLIMKEAGGKYYSL